jgi:hypothetical protein
VIEKTHKDFYQVTFRDVQNLHLRLRRYLSVPAVVVFWAGNMASERTRSQCYLCGVAQSCCGSLAAWTVEVRSDQAVLAEWYVILW